VPKALKLVGREEGGVNLGDSTYYVGRPTPIPSKKTRGMALWREKLFAFMLRNATHPIDFLKIPPEQVVELGLELEI
jgi:KUP system potassium uptake protein